MSLSVQFYYERYRFFKPLEFSQMNFDQSILAPTDTNTDPGTDPLIDSGLFYPLSGFVGSLGNIA